MTDEQIFLAALELPSQADRKAYLEMVCDANVELRRQVEERLTTHFKSGKITDEPVAPQMKAGLTTPVGEETVGVPTNSRGEADASAHLSDDELGELRFLEPSARADSLGRIGHYEVLQVLGKGGFGIVFRAFDDVLQRVVAIKVLAPSIAATSPARKRFLREAQASARVRHESVVQVHAVEEMPLPYLVMEFIAGETLQERLHRVGPLKLETIVEVGRQIAEGLAAAHDTGLIHRDIKPGNILIEGGTQERVKISDFGLARAADDASMTQSGTLVGTPMYMAPEQARGEPLDQRADLFSLGSVLYVMASGRPPFRAPTTFAVLKRVVEEDPRPIKDLIPETPQWLCDIISKLHARNPDERYQSAREVADVLAKCEAQFKVPAGLQDFSHIPSSKSHRTSSWKWLAAVSAMMLFLPFIAYGVFSLTRPKPVLVAKGDPYSVPSPASTKDVSVTDWQGWPADAPLPANVPFDAAQAKRFQEVWAAHLKLPVEYTNGIGMKFVLIPPGEFLMGSSVDEVKAALQIAGDDQVWRERIQSERPQHMVILTQPVYQGVTEVTQAQYEQVMGMNPSHFSATGAGKDVVEGMETGRHPVEMASWNDAAEFCARLSEQENLKPFYSRLGDAVLPMEGTGYRLPTEAEWEFACRAGAPTAYWIGDQDDDLAAAGWFGGWSGGNSENRTHAAAELKANPFGLFDVHGNVFEWVQDWWDPSYYKSLEGENAVNPGGPASARSQRVLRGGNWNYAAVHCRASHRVAAEPPYGNFVIGFRVVLIADSVRELLEREREAAATGKTGATSTTSNKSSPAIEN